MAAYELELRALSTAGVDVVAISTDGREGAEDTVAELGLTFPVGYGLPLVATAEALGCYYEERRGILHAAAYLVGPDRALQAVVTSAGPAGRLGPDDLLRLVRFWDRKRAQ